MGEVRKAVVIGIDAYKRGPLFGCVKDARAVDEILKMNDVGEPLNFDTELLVSEESEITTTAMKKAVGRLFNSSAAMALFYFAGHGVVDPDTKAAYLVAQNGSSDGWGLSINELISAANKAFPQVQSTVIILDCCHAGFAGEMPGFTGSEMSVIGTGVTILAASHRDMTAAENGQGLFTSILIDGLKGSAADILGNITPASLYTLADQTFGGFGQRPIYKANVQRFITLRQTAPKVERETLRKLPIYFEKPDDLYPLDPDHEEDRENIPLQFRHRPLDPVKVAIFKQLQACNRQGLVVPEGHPHMYDAAIKSTGCRLTSAGMHYRRLAELGRFGPIKK